MSRKPPQDPTQTPETNEPRPQAQASEFNPELKAAEDTSDTAEALQRLQNQQAVLTNKLQQAEELALARLAEIQNLKRIKDREVADARSYSLKTFIIELLPVIDSLEQGLANCDASDTNIESLRHGMALSLQMLNKVLEKFHVKVLDPVGEQYDSHFHEAMSIQPDDTVAPETVTLVVQKGYMIKNLVIRPARVIVTPK